MKGASPGAIHRLTRVTGVDASSNLLICYRMIEDSKTDRGRLYGAPPFSRSLCCLRLASRACSAAFLRSTLFFTASIAFGLRNAARYFSTSASTVSNHFEYSPYPPDGYNLRSTREILPSSQTTSTLSAQLPNSLLDLISGLVEYSILSLIQGNAIDS